MSSLTCVHCPWSAGQTNVLHLAAHGLPVPAEYQGMPVGNFTDVVQGPYTARSLAVIVETDDLDTMLNIMARHGLIRGVYKKWL